jgi:hypothetical protein
MTTREKLSNLQIVVMRSLVKRGGAYTPISLLAWQRRSTLNLWHRGFVEIWYKQAAGGQGIGHPIFARAIL